MSAQDPIISPFDASSPSYEEASRSVRTTAATTATTEYLDLTWENVEKVLDEMRPYLIQDGGNVVIADIDGPVVKLELQGACGTCPSSTQTLKMGYVVTRDASQ
jgi:Fe-S cluster biogenesis protein NfuA